MAAAMVGLRGAGTMLSDVPAGLLVARLGDKAVMVIGLSLLVAAAAGCAISDSAWVLGFLALGFGAGMGVWLLSRLTFITDNVRLDQRGRVISVMAGLQRAGALIGPLIAGFGAEIVGYGAVFAGAGVLFAVSLALIVIYAAGGKPSAIEHGPVRLTHVIAAHTRTFATAGVVMIVLSILRHARILIIPLVGVSIGLDESDIGLAFSLSSAIDMLMFYPAGQILDRLGRKFALMPAMSLLALAIVALPFTTQFWTFAIVAMIAGLGNGFGTGIFMTLGGDFSPAQGRSEFLGVWRLVGDIGGAVGPFAMGAVAQATSLVIACASTGGLAVVGLAVLVLFVPETLRKGDP